MFAGIDAYNPCNWPRACGENYRYWGKNYRQKVRTNVQGSGHKVMLAAGWVDMFKKSTSCNLVL